MDIAAELFKALKRKAENSTHDIMDEAVVAVPVGFSSRKKNNIRKAALKAGIKVIMFVSRADVGLLQSCFGDEKVS